VANRVLELREMIRGGRKRVISGRLKTYGLRPIEGKKNNHYGRVLNFSL